MRNIDRLLAADIFFGAAEAFGEAGVVEGEGWLRSWQNGGRGRLRMQNRALADNSQFRMDQPFVVKADAFHVVPKPLLNVHHGFSHRSCEIQMLRFDGVAKTRFQLPKVRFH